MKVKITAIRTVGFGCIKGDSAIYDGIDIVEDKGTYYSIRKRDNSLSVWETRARKENYSIEITM